MPACVIIAAHDEEAVIGRTLTALLRDAAPGELDVVVVCNGCTDRTADVARSAGPAVRVIELPEASKVLALRAGDGAASPGPRIYLDADTVLDTVGARQLVDALAQEGVRAASTTLELDLRRASWGVRSYYRIWRRLPSIDRGLAGRGVYALSEEGRSRFGEFPDLIADDLFVDLLFDADERSIVSSTSVVTVPTTLRALVANKTRVFVGNQQLARSGIASGARGVTSRRAWLDVVRQRPSLALDVPAYLWVTVVAKLGATRRMRRGETNWSRDATSRG